MPTISVQGMSCGHCQKAVTDAIAAISGVSAVTVDLQKAQADWTNANPASPVDLALIKAAIQRIGFTAG